MNCFVQSFIYEKSIPSFHGLCGIKNHQVKVDYLYVNNQCVCLFIKGFDIENEYLIDLKGQGYEKTDYINIKYGITTSYPLIKTICERRHSYNWDKLMRAMH